MELLEAQPLMPPRVPATAAWVVACALLGATAAWGQTPDPGGAGAAPPVPPPAGEAPAAQAEAGPVITEIVTENALDVELPYIRELMPFQEGDALQPALVRAALRRLYGLGFFERVEAYTQETGGGVRLVLAFTRIQRLRSVSIISDAAVPNHEIEQIFKIRPGEPLDPVRLDLSRRAITSHLTGAGYNSAAVNLAIEPDPPGASVRIIVQAGPPTVAASVNWRFTGPESHVPAAAIRQAIALRRGHRIDRAVLDASTASLETLYRSRDFLEATVRYAITPAPGDPLLAHVTFEIHEGPAIEIVFQGVTAFRRDDLLEAAGFDSVRDFNDLNAARLASDLQSFYRERGYLEATVSHRVQPRRAGQLKRVIMNVNEGRQALIAAVRFTGLETLSESRLARWLFETLKGASDSNAFWEGVAGDPVAPDPAPPPFTRPAPQTLGRFIDDPSRFYFPERFRDALAEIQRRLERQGFLDARVGVLTAPRGEVSQRALDRSGDPIAEISGGGRHVYVTVPVQEGPRTRISAIAVDAGNPDLERDLSAFRLLAPGMPYDSVFVDAEQKRLLRVLEALGYIYAQVQYARELSPDRTQAALSFRVTPGPRVHVRRIGYPHGLVITEPRPILEEVKLVPGDVWSAPRVAGIRRNIERLGVFESVSLTPSNAEIPEPEKDLDIAIRERPPITLKPGFGISSDDGVRALAELQNANLFGYALEFFVRAKVNYQVFRYVNDDADEIYFSSLSTLDSIERKFDIGLLYPRVYGFPSWRNFPENVSSRLDLIYERENARAYGLDKVSLVPGLDFDLGRGLKLGLQYEAEFNSLEPAPVEVPPELLRTTQALLLPPAGQTIIGTIRPTLALDLRDNITNPRRGAFFSTSFEYARALAGDLPVNFIKVTGQTNAYVPLRRTTFAVSARAGNIFAMGGTAIDGRPRSELKEFERRLEARAATPLNKRFFLGGRSTLRGFSENALVPAFAQYSNEQIAENADIGGQVLSLGGNTFLLLKGEWRFPIASSLNGALFNDWGGLWQVSSDFSWSDLRPGAGFGIRVDTPVGPFALDFGFNVLRNRVLREPLFRLHFSIGVF